MSWMKDEAGLDKTPANFVPLTPLSHLARASRVFPGRTAVIDGAHRKTYAEYHARVSRLASALSKRGIQPGDVVSTILPNTYAHAEAHFGVPACGAVLNTINIRLDVSTVAYIFDHSEAAIFRRPEHVPPLVEAAIAAFPPGVIWMQIGVRHPEAAAMAEAAGWTVIQDRCPKIEYQRLFGELRMGGFATGVISSKL